MTKLVDKDAIHIVEEDDVQQPPHYREDGPPQVLTPDTVRSGTKGTPVLWVLIFGLLAVGVAWVILHWFVH